MKLLVETTGAFMLMDRQQGAEIDMGIPHVVARTRFVEQRLGMGQLRVLGQLVDHAAQGDFAEFWREARGDRDLAVASFLSAFALDAEPREEEEEAEPKPKGKRRK